MLNPVLTDLLGYAAAGLVLATFSARSLRALRSLAIASNVVFITYAAFAHLAPVLLHALLLPLNVWRLRETLRSDGVRRQGAVSSNWASRLFRHRCRARWQRWGEAGHLPAHPRGLRAQPDAAVLRQAASRRTQCASGRDAAPTGIRAHCARLWLAKCWIPGSVLPWP